MIALASVALLAAQVATPPAPSPPIIDMHLHAMGAAELGPPGSSICAPYERWPERDPGNDIGEYVGRVAGAPDCKRALTAPLTDEAIRTANVAELERLNIIGVASGPADQVERLHREAPNRIIPALSFGATDLPPIAELRALHAAGRLEVMGEITAQYGGIAPDDPRLEPYYALAEELDIPVAIHLGPGPPGVAYFASPAYRARFGDPLLLEDVLTRHPKLRLYAMHAGWPLADAMIALMYAHPQVYVDTGVIDYAFTRTDFHAYLKRLVDAGFGKRIMFGSDQMIWPQAIAAAVEGIDSAPFLSPEQKRDIFYNNAARFLRLSPAEMADHRGE